MSKARQEKLTSTLKDALVRNAMAEQRMKAEVGVLHTDVNKQIQSMKAFKNKYEKRQKELQQIKAARNLTPDDGESPSRPGSAMMRKSSAPATLFVETIGLNLGHGSTEGDRSPQLPKRRSLSSVTLPKLEVSSYGDPDKSAERQPGGTRLPTLTGRPASASPGKQNHVSPPRPQSAMLSVNSQQMLSRSAPSSPAASRRSPASPVFGMPPSRRCVSPTAKRFEDILQGLQRVQEKKIPDLDSFASISEWRRLNNAANANDGNSDDDDDVVKLEDTGKAKKVRPKSAQSRALPLPGTILTSPAVQGTSDQDDSDTLAQSMHKIKYCKYLRHSVYEDVVSDELPKELIPTSLIVGSIKTVDFSGQWVQMRNIKISSFRLCFIMFFFFGRIYRTGGCLSCNISLWEAFMSGRVRYQLLWGLNCVLSDAYTVLSIKSWKGTVERRASIGKHTLTKEIQLAQAFAVACSTVLSIPHILKFRNWEAPLYCRWMIILCQSCTCFAFLPSQLQ